MREEVRKMMQVCETFAGVAHEHALTDEERELIVNLDLSRSPIRPPLNNCHEGRAV